MAYNNTYEKRLVVGTKEKKNLMDFKHRCVCGNEYYFSYDDRAVQKVCPYCGRRLG